MFVEILPLEDIPGGLHVFVKGTWDYKEFSRLMTALEEQQPDYLVLDPTHSIIPHSQQQPISDTDDLGRLAVLTRMVQLMRLNPRMLYIIVNRNDTPSLKTGVSLFEEYGVADRHFFAKSTEEALAIISKYQDDNETP